MGSKVNQNLIPTKTREKLDKALDYFNSLRSIKFTNQKEYETGDYVLSEIKGYINSIESDRKDLVKPLNDKVKSINDAVKVVREKLENAERVIKRGMSDYYVAERRRQQEEQRRLEAEAEERRRREEEKARKEREKEEAYREQGRDELADKAAARAQTSEEIADTHTAPIVENKAKLSGTSFITGYSVEVTDKHKAINSLSSNPFLTDYLTIDVKGLEKLVSAKKGDITIDGIKIIENIRVSKRI